MILQLLEEISEPKVAKEFPRYRQYFENMSDEDAEQLFVKIISLDPNSFSRNDPTKLETVGQAASGNGILMKDWIAGKRDFINDAEKCKKITDTLTYFYANRNKFPFPDIRKYDGIDSFLNAASGEGEVLTTDQKKKPETPDEKLEERRKTYYSNIPDLETFKKILKIDPNSDVDHGQIAAAGQFLIDRLNRQLDLLNEVFDYSFLIKKDFIKKYKDNFKGWQTLTLDDYLEEIKDSQMKDLSNEIINGSSRVFTALRYAIPEDEYIVWAANSNYALITPKTHRAAAIMDAHWYTDSTKSEYFNWLDKIKQMPDPNADLHYSPVQCRSNEMGSCYINRWCTGYGNSYWSNSDYRDSSGKHYLVCFINLNEGDNPRNNAQASMLYDSDLKHFVLHGCYAVLDGSDEMSSSCVDDAARIVINTFTNNPDLLAQCNSKLGAAVKGFDPINWTQVTHDYEYEESNRITMIGKHLLNNFKSLGLDATEDKLSLPIDLLKKLSEPFVYTGQTLSKKDLLTISELHIDSSITSIPDFTFEFAPNLLTVIIPGNVKKIGNCSFRGCKSLVDLRLNEGLEEIGYNAFDGCIELAKSITLPDSLKLIKAGAFMETAAKFRINPKTCDVTVQTMSDGDLAWWNRKGRITER